MAERAPDGLTQVMIVKSRVVLPYLVPQVGRTEHGKHNNVKKQRIENAYFLFLKPYGVTLIGIVLKRRFQ